MENLVHCITCDGSGNITRDKKKEDGSCFVDKKVCHICNGTGRRDTNKPLESVAIAIENTLGMTCSLCGCARWANSELCPGCELLKVAEKNERLCELLDICSDFVYDCEEDVTGDIFCLINNCGDCEGTDQSGEPNGYGCDPRDSFTDDFLDALKDKKYDKCLSLIESMKK